MELKWPKTGSSYKVLAFFLSFLFLSPVVSERTKNGQTYSVTYYFCVVSIYAFTKFRRHSNASPLRSTGRAQYEIKRIQCSIAPEVINCYSVSDRKRRMANSKDTCRFGNDQEQKKIKYKLAFNFNIK